MPTPSSESSSKNSTTTTPTQSETPDLTQEEEPLSPEAWDRVLKGAARAYAASQGHPKGPPLRGKRAD